MFDISKEKFKIAYKELMSRDPKPTAIERGKLFVTFLETMSFKDMKEVLYEVEKMATLESAKTKICKEKKKYEDSLKKEDANMDEIQLHIADSDAGADETFYESHFPIADIRNIPRAKLEEAPKAMNFFGDLNEGRFTELKVSIEKQGILHNLVVQELENGNFRILSGHQRVRACDELFEETKDAKYQEFPCKVYKKDDLSEEDARRIVILTNTAQRGTLSLPEQIRSISELTELEKKKSFYGSGDVTTEVAKRLNLSRSAVFRLKNLGNLIVPLKNECGNKKDGKTLSLRDGEVISYLTPELQKHIYDKGYYQSDFLTATRVKALRQLLKDATVEDVDKIFAGNRMYSYTITTTVEQPQGFKTLAVHVAKEDELKLLQIIKAALDKGELAASKEVLLKQVEEVAHDSIE